MTEQSLNCLGKTPELKDRLNILVMVGRSAGRRCFRREVCIGSRSQKVLDVWVTRKVTRSVYLTNVWSDS